MIKTVIDTNVFISAIIGRGYSKLIVDKIFYDRSYYLCYSNESMIEIERVIQYPHLTKRKKFSDKAQNILENIRIFGIEYHPSIKISFLNDPSDNKFLELSVAAKADYLITGNHNDFTITNFQGTKIVSPKQFWELYEQNQL